MRSLGVVNRRGDKARMVGCEVEAGGWVRGSKKWNGIRWLKMEQFTRYYLSEQCGVEL